MEGQAQGDLLTLPLSWEDYCVLVAEIADLEDELAWRAELVVRAEEGR
jgi:hypothetical protein